MLKGFGKFIDKGDRILVGEWLNNMMHGEGTETLPNGDTYKGEFRFHQRHGHGIVYYKKSGHTLECDWNRGLRVGTGEFTLVANQKDPEAEYGRLKLKVFAY